MLTIKTTPSGIGVKLQGDAEEFRAIYDLVGKIDNAVFPGFDESNCIHMMLMAFNYDVRHAFLDADFTLMNRHKSVPAQLKYTWADIIFFMSIIRQSAAYVSLTSAEMKLLNGLDDKLIDAMFAYDPVGAEENKNLLKPKYDFDTEGLFLIQHDLHNQHINLYTGKKGFRKLPGLMHSHLDYMGFDRYDILSKAEKNAKKYKCNIRDLKNTSDYLEVTKW